MAEDLVIKYRLDGDQMVATAQHFQGDRLEVAVAAHLAKNGHTVTGADIPGLYRVDGGPELTLGQLLQIASEA